MKFNLEKVGETINAKECMTSKEIADLTGKEHKIVMRDIRNLIDQLGENNGYIFVLVEYTDAKGEKRPMYELDKKSCLLLASGYNVVLRSKIIDRWEELESKERRNVPALPQTYLEALKTLVKSEEEKQQALLEAKEAKDHVKLLVHNGKTYTSSEIAKELGMKSAIYLNKLLEEKRIQYKQNGTWLMYSEYSEKGYTSVKQIQLDNGTIQYDRRWTGKGRDFIINLFKTK